MGPDPPPQTSLLKIFQNNAKIVRKSTKDFFGFVIYKYKNIKIRYYDTETVEQNEN